MNYFTKKYLKFTNRRGFRINKFVIQRKIFVKNKPIIANAPYRSLLLLNINEINRRTLDVRYIVNWVSSMLTHKLGVNIL